MRTRRSTAAVLLALLGSLAGPAAAMTPPATEAVIVSGPGASRAVRTAGGTVTRDLPIVDGVAARLTPAGATALRRGGLVVVPDERVTVQADDSAVDDFMHRPIDPAHVGSVNAYRLWMEGVRGQGSRVALIDTGITETADLRGRVVPVADPSRPDGPLVPCVDFSGEESCADSYGHGTFMAGLIAGDGRASGGRYTGIAPRAELISVKIAGRDGSADVSKVLAAIQWVVSFRETYGIDVLNLSLGTDSPISARLDPLNYAVEKAWAAGLVVVVSASNRGPLPGTIAKPGDDPYVITVGAVDDQRTMAVDDDRLPDFSGRGPTRDGLSKPDVVAPGGRVISLRSPGSTVEQLAPGGGVDGTYRRGSGTSMSTAVVSGVAALVLQANQGWTPDQVKDSLLSTARTVATGQPYDVGHGIVDAWAAARRSGTVPEPPVPPSTSDASGTLDRSRGSVYVTAECVDSGVGAPQCVALRGERTAQGELWNAEQYRGTDWTGSSWYASQWTTGVNGSSWYGSSWYGSSWYGANWQGSSWYTGREDTQPYGIPIPGSVWYGVWG